MSTIRVLPYCECVNRQRPACVLFLLDQSGSMEDPIGGTHPPQRKCDALADAINRWLNNMIIRSSWSYGVTDLMHVGIVGYSTDEQGHPIVGSALQGALANEPLVPISKIHQFPLRVVDRLAKVFDEENGESLEIPIQVPAWVDPVFRGGTPMCHALFYGYRILEPWIAAHADSFPPIVVHVTDGESYDGDPIPYARSIRENLATDNGNVLLFNCHLSTMPADKVLFPVNEELLPDQLARLLFKMSSILPEPVSHRARREGISLQPNARGFVFNADQATLMQFLNVGALVEIN
jgi:hypothetical protein